GRALEEERGLGWMEGIHPDDRRRWEEGFTAAFAGHRPFELEFRLLRADGEYRWLLGSGAPLSDPAGLFGGHIGSCVGLPDRRRAEGASRFLAEPNNGRADPPEQATHPGAGPRL